MYNFDTESIVSEFKLSTEKCTREISGVATDRIAGAESLVDIQYKIACYFVSLLTHGVMPWRRGHKELTPLLFSLFHKNFFAFFSALDQTIKGLYGPTRPLLRYIFESLMISKFCNISDDPRVMKRWADGNTVYFTNSILKKIITPNPQPFIDYWERICQYSHSTKSSLQISFDLEENIDEVTANLALINALLECNYHLLNSHLITPELEYTVKFYIQGYQNPREKYTVSELRKQAHQQFKKNRAFLGKDSVRLISAYKRKWVLKT